MKKVLLLILVNAVTIAFSQTNTMSRVFPIDTLGMMGGRNVFVPDQNRTRLKNDSIFFNADLQYLSMYYNTHNEDTLRYYADTIMYRYSKIYLYDPTLHVYADTFPEKIGFYWRKSILFNESMISGSSTWSKDASGCTSNKYEDASGYKCYEELICWDYPQDYWCSDYSYTKIFEDNFEGNKLNTDFWILDHNGNGDLIPSDVKVSFNSDPAVNSGTLKLIAECHSSTPYTDPIDGSVHTNQYSSANVTTAMHFGFGKYEMRAKVPNPYGINPSFWIHGLHYEMDCFEFFTTNRADLPTFTLYTDANYQDFDSKCIVYQNVIRMSQNRADNLYGYGSWSSLPDLSSDWHTYVMIFDPEYVMWLIDDTWGLILFKKMVYGSGTFYCGCSYCTTIYHAQSPSIEGGLQLTLQNAIWDTKSYNFPHGVTHGPTPGTQEVFEIDWVKVYQKDNCAVNKTLATTGPITSTSNYSGSYSGFQYLQNNQKNDITADNITFGGQGENSPYTVKWYPWDAGNLQDDILFARADNEIELKDGFSVLQGAVFEGTIAYDGRNLGPGWNPPQGPSDCSNIDNTYTQYVRTAGSNNSNNSIYYGQPKNNQAQSVSVENIQKEVNNLRVYPNPAHNELYITGLSNYSAYEILDATFNKVRANDKQEKIDISGLSSGLYFLRIYCNDKVIIHKFIKE